MFGLIFVDKRVGMLHDKVNSWKLFIKEEMMLKPGGFNGRENSKTTAITRGFSLVEVLIVIAILGVVSGMAVLAWQRIVDNNNLRTAARDVAADMALYRQKAMGKNDNYKISFDIANNSYSITHLPKAGGAADPAVNKLLSVFGSGVKLQSLTFTANDIDIQSRGLVDAGSITLVNGRGSQAVITVGFAGRTNLQFTMQ
jgi:prepilin-type N-terminal cleavage/methylation domain-containing protein